ncbi:hypothetical protein ABFY53_25775 [Serratia nematodiphila]
MLQAEIARIQKEEMKSSRSRWQKPRRKPATA